MTGMVKEKAVVWPGLVHAQFTNLAECANGTSYQSIGRTVETLGLAGLSADAMQRFVHDGLVE
jgi:hypothetical protein